MIVFARSLPALRSVVEHDLALGDLSREQVLACAARLLDRGFFRIGSEEYAVTNETYGLATMLQAPRDDRRRHGQLRLHRQGVQAPRAGGRSIPRSRRSSARSSAAAAAARSCWPTRTAAAGCDVRSPDINAYLKAATGADISAKDFRTWGATVLAAVGLAVNRPEQLSHVRAQARDHARRQGGRLLPRQHADGGAQLLHRPAHLRPLPRRPDDHSSTSSASSRARRRSRGPVEEAVLDLLEG